MWVTDNQTNAPKAVLSAKPNLPSAEKDQRPHPWCYKKNQRTLYVKTNAPLMGFVPQTHPESVSIIKTNTTTPLGADEVMVTVVDGRGDDGCGIYKGDDGSMMGGDGVWLLWWWFWRRWRRVVASGVVDRVDRVKGSIFGFGRKARRKSFPPPAVVVAAGCTSGGRKT
nr:hypothetical protein [Tanacetum cinerariifolium]